MALIKCHECGNQVSDKATYCPHCGYPLLDKTSTKIEPNKKSFTIAYRSGPGSILAACIIGVVIFAGGTSFAIYIFLQNYRILFLNILAILICVLSILLLFLSIMNFTFIGMNARRKEHNCIEYNAEKDKLILYTLFGEYIEIDVSDYISLKDNFLTDNMLFFTYRTKSGKARKVRLGYCSNRDEIRANIAKINKG